MSSVPPKPAHPTAPGRRRGASGVAYAWLRAEILSGRLKPGSALSESEIALKLAVCKVPHACAEQRHAAAEVVRERQEEEHHVALEREVVDAAGCVDHGEVVAVQDHAALGRAGRARRVDEGVEVVLADLRGGTFDGVGIRVRVVAATRA